MDFTWIQSIWSQFDSNTFQIGAYSVLGWYLIGATFGAVLDLYRKS